MADVATYDPPSDGAPAQVERRRRWTARDLAVYAFYRRRLLRNCLLLGILAGVAAAATARTWFTADALLIVLVGMESAAVQNQLDLSNTQISVDGLKAVQAEIQIIQTDDVLRAALEHVGVEKMYPRLAQPRLFGLLPAYDATDRVTAAIEQFRRDMRAEAQSTSNAIRIAVTHDDRDLAIRAVQAVTDAYLARRSAIFANHNVTILGDEIGRFSARMKLFEKQILDVKRKHDVLDMAQDIVLATNRLDGIAQRQNQVRERRVAVQTEIVAVRANLAQQPATVLDFRETTNNTGNDEARNTLVRLMQERAHLLTQFNERWPAMIELDKKIATVRSQMTGSGQALYFAERTIRNPAVDVLNNRLASLEVEEEALGQQLVELEEQSRIAADRIASLREAEAQLHQLGLNRDVAESIFRQLSLRQPRAIFNEDTVVDENTNVRMAQPPTAPLRGRNLALSYVVGGGFLGLLLGVAGVSVATVLQRSYIMPAEAEADLELASLGEVSATREGYDGAGIVAANLLGMAGDGRQLSMIQILSTEDAALQAGFARALGESFAQVFAMPTLLLDLTGAPLPAGTTVEAKEADMPFALARTGVDGLSFSVDAARALFTERRFASMRDWEVPEKLRRRFAVILVLGPNELSDPWMRRLTPLVDASVLVIRAETTRSAVAARYRETILEGGGTLAGFVFVGRRFYIPRWLYRRL